MFLIFEVWVFLSCLEVVIIRICIDYLVIFVFYFIDYLRWESFDNNVLEVLGREVFLFSRGG